MQKYEILVNNVERVEHYLEIYQRIRNIKMNSIFAHKMVRKLAKKIPKKYDVESIKKFEEETGLKLKYHVYYHKYGFFEYTSLGIWPYNEVERIDENGKPHYHLKDIKKNHLEYADILIIDQISDMGSTE